MFPSRSTTRTKTNEATKVVAATDKRVSPCSDLFITTCENNEWKKKITDMDVNETLNMHANTSMRNFFDRKKLSWSPKNCTFRKKILWNIQRNIRMILHVTWFISGPLKYYRITIIFGKVSVRMALVFEAAQIAVFQNHSQGIIHNYSAYEIVVIYSLFIYMRINLLEWSVGCLCKIINRVFCAIGLFHDGNISPAWTFKITVRAEILPCNQLLITDNVDLAWMQK